jgi:hypothetical protein
MGGGGRVADIVGTGGGCAMGTGEAVEMGDGEGPTVEAGVGVDVGARVGAGVMTEPGVGLAIATLVASTSNATVATITPEAVVSGWRAPKACRPTLVFGILNVALKVPWPLVDTLGMPAVEPSQVSSIRLFGANP